MNSLRIHGYPYIGYLYRLPHPFTSQRCRMEDGGWNSRLTSRRNSGTRYQYRSETRAPLKQKAGIFQVENFKNHLKNRKSSKKNPICGYSKYIYIYLLMQVGSTNIYIPGTQLYLIYIGKQRRKNKRVLVQVRKKATGQTNSSRRKVDIATGISQLIVQMRSNYTSFLAFVENNSLLHVFR